MRLFSEQASQESFGFIYTFAQMCTVVIALDETAGLVGVGVEGV